MISVMYMYLIGYAPKEPSAWDKTWVTPEKRMLNRGLFLHALFIFTLIKPCHFLRFCLQDFIYIRILTTEAVSRQQWNREWFACSPFLSLTTLYIYYLLLVSCLSLGVRKERGTGGYGLGNSEPRERHEETREEIKWWGELTVARAVFVKDFMNFFLYLLARRCFCRILSPFNSLTVSSPS